MREIQGREGIYERKRVREGQSKRGTELERDKVRKSERQTE